jgi:membrane protein required for beta-lactamase induction
MAVDQIDQVDRAISSRRHPSPADQVGRGIGRVTHWVSALVRRILVLTLGLIKTTIAAIPSVLRSVARAARGLVSRVGDLVRRIAHSAVGIVRLPAGKVTGHEEQ